MSRPAPAPLPAAPWPASARLLDDFRGRNRRQPAALYAAVMASAEAGNRGVELYLGY